MPSKFFAHFYDRMIQGMEKTHFSGVRKNLLPKIDGDLLEIGSGTGANLPYFKKTDPGKKVFLEYNPWMIEKSLQKSLRHFGNPVRASASALPFNDESFDTVLITLVLCSVDDLTKTLGEVNRVLKPGGKLLLLEHVISDSLWMAKLQTAITPLWKHLAGGCHLDRNIGEELRKIFLVREQNQFFFRKTPFIYGVYEKRH